jgi:hypothetical protein
VQTVHIIANVTVCIKGGEHIELICFDTCVLFEQRDLIKPRVLWEPRAHKLCISFSPIIIPCKASM